MGTLNKRADFRIDRMVAANEAHEASVAIVADLRKTSQVAGWHEKHRRAVGGKTMGEKAEREAAGEVVMADVATKRLRAARMKERMAMDDARWEAELNAVGLTVAKERS
jgi:hypothetical protein